MADREAFLTNKIFLNAALPLLKVIAADVPGIHKMFANVHCVYQVSCLDADAPDGKYAIHFVVNGDEWKIHPRVEPKPMVELEFKSVDALNAFFKGKIAPATLPKMKGVLAHPAAFAAFMAALLKMAGLLGMTTPPEDEDTKRLLVKCYFSLLSAGISQLNKNGHEEIHDWAMKSPDRVYAFAVVDEPTVGAFIRVKAGKTKAGKGEYKRAMPFFTLKFRDLDAALGTLMSIDDMMDATKAGKIIMEGAPEFGAQIGAYMLLVGALAK